MHIKLNTTQPLGLPKTYQLDDGRTITNFDQLTDQERIALAQVYPVTGEPTLEPWQSKSNPIYTFTATEAQVSYTITDLSLPDYKARRIAEVYQIAKQKMDAQAEGYSQAEIATWPEIQADVVNYNSTTAVGTALQLASDTSAYTVSELAAILTPRIVIQTETVFNRSSLVSDIKSCTDYMSVKDVDITVGWPA